MSLSLLLSLPAFFCCFLRLFLSSPHYSLLMSLPIPPLLCVLLVSYYCLPLAVLPHSLSHCPFPNCPYRVFLTVYPPSLQCLTPFSFSCFFTQFTLFWFASAHCAASLVCFIGGVCISRATQVVNLLLIPQTKLHFFAELVVVVVAGGGGASAVASVTHHFVKYCCFAYLQQQQQRRLSSALLQLLELNSVLSETRFQSTWRTTATMLAPQT